MVASVSLDSVTTEYSAVNKNYYTPLQTPVATLWRPNSVTAENQAVHVIASNQWRCLISKHNDIAFREVRLHVPRCRPQMYSVEIFLAVLNHS